MIATAIAYAATVVFIIDAIGFWAAPFFAKEKDGTDTLIGSAVSAVFLALAYGAAYLGGI